MTKIDIPIKFVVASYQHLKSVGFSKPNKNFVDYSTEISALVTFHILTRVRMQQEAFKPTNNWVENNKSFTKFYFHFILSKWFDNGSPKD